MDHQKFAKLYTPSSRWKSTRLISYVTIWPGSLDPAQLELVPKEFDDGIHEVISKVDFDFVKSYLLCVFLRYVKPVQESDARGIEIQHITILSSRQYLYMMTERLDAWPPAVIPPEISIGLSSVMNQNLGMETRVKGFLIDKVPQFNLLGVGRISDVTRIERWKSWRIDESLGCSDLKGLGQALQNGHIGYLNQFDSHFKQQASTSGWFWWVRICFGYTDQNSLHPSTPPTIIPPSGYWWDLAFSTRESSNELIECIRVLRTDNVIQFVLGDD